MPISLGSNSSYVYSHFVLGSPNSKEDGATALVLARNLGKVIRKAFTAKSSQYDPLQVSRKREVGRVLSLKQTAPDVSHVFGSLETTTSKCASRHNGVHYFDIATCKSGPTLVCFVHFDFEMCFAPQRRALFHLSSGQMAPHPPL